MYHLARESQASGGSTRGQDDDNLKVPTLPKRTSETMNPELDEKDRKMPAASTPGAVAAPPTARDPAAVKQAAARDPARLSLASPNTAYNRSDAHRSSQTRQIETDEDIKQRYRLTDATDKEILGTFPCTVPGAIEMAGIEATKTKLSPPDAAHNVSEASEARDSTQTHQIETDEDIKQRYRSAGATDEETPGATRVAGIDGSTTESFDDTSYEKDRATTIDACPVVQDPTFTEPTVTAQLAPTDDEVMKRFVEDIPVAEAEAAPNRKRWIILGGIGLLACAGLGAGLGVALSDDSSPRAAPSPPIRADTCLPDTNNPEVFNCFKEHFPGTPTTTFFFNCPTNDEEKIFDCEFCLVEAISDINDLDVEDTFTCNGCIICEDDVSFDCTNLFPEEECALQTCSGNCGKAPVPSPSPDTEANACNNSVELDTYFCNKEDIPFDFLVTQFQDCPPGAENNVYECQSCFVAFEDTVADIDAATSQVCNGCINCGDSVAFDCSNLFPGQECAAVDCDGTCIGDRQA